MDWIELTCGSFSRSNLVTQRLQATTRGGTYRASLSFTGQLRRVHRPTRVLYAHESGSEPGGQRNGEYTDERRYGVDDCVDVTADHFVTTITLNEPGKLNRLSSRMQLALNSALEHARTSGARVVVIRGEGR